MVAIWSLVFNLNVELVFGAVSSFQCGTTRAQISNFRAVSTQVLAESYDLQPGNYFAVKETCNKELSPQEVQELENGKVDLRFGVTELRLTPDRYVLTRNKGTACKPESPVLDSSLDENHSVYCGEELQVEGNYEILEQGKIFFSAKKFGGPHWLSLGDIYKNLSYQVLDSIIVLQYPHVQQNMTCNGIFRRYFLLKSFTGV